MLDELVSHQVERLVPAGFDELTIAPNQRLLEPVGVVHILEAEAAFDAQHALAGCVGRLIIRAHDQLVGRDVKSDPAANTAIRTCRLDLLDRFRSYLLGVDRLGRTGREARSARGAERL